MVARVFFSICLFFERVEENIVLLMKYDVMMFEKLNENFRCGRVFVFRDLFNCKE